MIARFYSGTNVTELASSGAATATLPSGLHMVPGAYLVDGLPYQCNSPGLYRWFNPDTGVCKQRVCWTNDIASYVSAWSWMHMDGKREDGLDIATLQNTARSQMLSMSCGYIADLLRQLILQWPFPARLVQMSTADTPNGYDDGHIVVEEKSTGAWRLWDVTNGCCFTDGTNHLSLKGIIDLGVANCTRVNMSEKRVSYGLATMAAGTFDYGLWHEFLFANSGQVDAWCERIYRIPSVKANGVWSAYMPSGTESRQSWMQAQGFTILTKAAWESAFYP